MSPTSDSVRAKRPATLSPLGSLCLPAEAPWDGIVVAAAAPEVPDALREQLGDGRRLVIQPRTVTRVRPG